MPPDDNPPPKEARFSIRNRAKSFRYAWNGFCTLVKREHNARIHSLAAISAVLFGFLLKISNGEWFALLLCIALVFVTELINSALEEISDALHPGKDVRIGRAKDYAAAAVFVSSLIALGIGLLIFLPRIIKLL
ncbi:MAG: diacylglycerol kinase family protein [Bacteroidales bacterium]